MKTPHLGLMRAYDNTDVFFKKASGEARLSDQVGQLFAGQLLEKVARLPMPPGSSLAKLAPPSMRSMLGGKPATPISDGLAAATKPAPMPKTAPATPGMRLTRPNVNDFTVNQGVTSSAPAAPAKQVASPLASPRVGGTVTGGHAPNVNDFTKQPQQGLLSRTMGRLTGQKETGAPTINPMAAPQGSTPVAADKPLAKASPAPAGAPAEGSSSSKGGLPWNRMLLTGGLLGAGALGLGAMKAGLNFLGGGHGGAANYGAAPGGYTPPMGVNGYGYPQMGTPLM